MVTNYWVKKNCQRNALLQEQQQNENFPINDGELITVTGMVIVIQH